MSIIAKRLRASVGMDAVNGSREERAVCEKQMREAATELDRLAKRIAEQDAEIARLQKEIQIEQVFNNSSLKMIIDRDEEITRLQGLLRERDRGLHVIGRHEPGCPGLYPSGNCICGHDDVADYWKEKGL